MKGIGVVEWEIVNQHGVLQVLTTTAYFIPEATIRLFSPKTFVDEDGNDNSSLFLNKKECVSTLGDGVQLSFPYQNNNLPMMLTPDMVEPKHMFHLDLSGNAILNHTCVGERNLNLSAPQKELLKWHQKLAHLGFQWIQCLMLPRFPRTKFPPKGIGIILTKHASTRVCEPPLCDACHRSRATIKGAGVNTTVPRMGKVGGIVNELNPGECVSTD